MFGLAQIQSYHQQPWLLDIIITFLPISGIIFQSRGIHLRNLIIHQKIKSLFESSDIPADVVKDIDGWLKYHAAFVIPINCVLFMHKIDN